MNTRSLWSVLIYTLVLWSVTTGLSLYGMWRDPWIGEQGSGEHPLIFVGTPLWFGLIGTSALGVPLPIAALIGAVLQFMTCLPIGFLLRWLITMRKSHARRSHSSIRGPLIIVNVIILHVMTTRAVPGEQPAEAVDFRTRRAPAVIHILDAPGLVRILGPDDQQRPQLQATVDRWKADYLKKVAELEDLPVGDIRRRTWSPKRDRILGATIGAILAPAQQEMLSRMTFLWNYTPVSFSNVLRDEYAQRLKLAPEQQEALYHLNVQWVLYALEDLDDGERENSGPGRMQTRYRSVINPAWRFKRTRDAAWRRILTEKQTEQWKHIELRQAFRIDPLVVLKPYTRAWMHTFLNAGQFPVVLVPYFDPPAAALMWTPEQEQQIRKMVADLETEAARIQAIAGRAERRAAWANIGTRMAQLRENVVELMTDSQRATWRKMTGGNSADQTNEPSPPNPE